MKIEDKILKEHLRASKSDLIVQTEGISRIRFEALLSGLKSKLIISKSEKAEEQLADVEWMERNLQRQMFINVNHSFQAKLIMELQSQVLKVELDKISLIEENVKLKKSIK